MYNITDLKISDKKISEDYDMFLCRNNEINDLKNVLKSSGKAIILYGKRRVGKTSLLKEIMKDEPCIYYECLKDSLESNILSFKDSLSRSGYIIPNYVSFSSFIDVFEYIESVNKKVNVIIDEYPYLKEMTNPNTVDTMFQKIIDSVLKNCNLILCGSSVKIMNELLTEGNPLFGRFALIINLPELNYVEVSGFYPDKTIYEKIAFYSCFGGSPYVNECINPVLSLKENIINLFLDEKNPVFNYADNVLISDATNILQAKRIVSVLGNSKEKYSKLEEKLDKEKTGKINTALKSLLELGIVKKVFPINTPTDIKKSYYEINDNAIRFFYTYVQNSRSALITIGKNLFYDSYIAPSIDTYISHRFEEQVRMYFSLLAHKGCLSDVKNIGTYYFDNPEEKSNGEFDVALEKADGYEIYEVKYRKDPLNFDIVEKEIKQIEKINAINITKIGFVNPCGFSFKNDDYDLIDGNNLYNF